MCFLLIDNKFSSPSTGDSRSLLCHCTFISGNDALDLKNCNSTGYCVVTDPLVRGCLGEHLPRTDIPDEVLQFYLCVESIITYGPYCNRPVGEHDLKGADVVLEGFDDILVTVS